MNAAPLDLLVGGEATPGLRWPDVALQGGRLAWPAVRAALDAGRHRVRDWQAEVGVATVQFDHPFTNVNDAATLAVLMASHSETVSL